MNNSTKKTAWGIIGVLVVLLVIVFGYRAMRDNGNGSRAGRNGDGSTLSDILPSTGVNVSPDNNASSSTTTVATASNNGSKAPSPSLKYQEALAKYQYRIQFSNCHGVVSPGNGTLSIKQNIPFMLDNRDPVAHTIAFAGQSYKIAAYDFAIATPKKVGEFPVTCDGGGAAFLNVEK
jgi:hypothetical protein